MLDSTLDADDVPRWFRSLKEECVWQQQFGSFAEAQQAIQRWIAWYNIERPHQALGYLSPQHYAQLHGVGPPEPPIQCLRGAQLGRGATKVGQTQARGAAATRRVDTEGVWLV